MQSEQSTVLAGFFDDCARRGLMSSFSAEELLKVEALERLWQISDGERVFEPGCGSGRLTERLARHVGPKGQVVACDLSPEMIRRARSRVATPNAMIHEAAALNLDLPDASFDAVICFCAFPHFEDLPQTLACFRRVLKPGGRFWISHLDGRERLNAFHDNAGPVVRLHLLPDKVELKTLLAEAGMFLRVFHDGTDGYWAMATPS